MDEETKKQYEMLREGRTAVEDNLLLYGDSKKALPYQILELVSQPVVSLADFRELREKRTEVDNFVAALEVEKAKIEGALQFLEAREEETKKTEEQPMAKILEGPWKR